MPYVEDRERFPSTQGRGCLQTEMQVGGPKTGDWRVGQGWIWVSFECHLQESELYPQSNGKASRGNKNGKMNRSCILGYFCVEG